VAAWEGPVEDELVEPTVHSSETVFEGAVWDVRRDDVELGDGQVVTREVVDHTGAVGVLALDDQDRVLLVRQYRHPVRSFLWEAPAGLLDVSGEDPLEAAKRELVEEAGYRADEWHVLLDFYNSPGGTTEAFRCYLARGLHEVAEDERHQGEGEEKDMPAVWLPLDEARDLVMAGKLHNPSAVTGILAACVARATGWAGLRPGDAAWPEKSPGRG
jgi:8-oxo-dGTP pyrophosphatase MutT (NUDIX family)